MTGIRTALCWIVWHNVHGQQHTYMSSSYRSSRLGLSHLDLYAVHRGGCLELYYCNMVEWFWWYSSLNSTTNWFVQCFDDVSLVIWPVKIVPEMTYNVLSGTLKPWLDVKQELIMDEIPERDVTYHLTCLLIYHGTTTHLYSFFIFF